MTRKSKGSYATLSKTRYDAGSAAVPLDRSHTNICTTLSNSDCPRSSPGRANTWTGYASESRRDGSESNSLIRLSRSQDYARAGGARGGMEDWFNDTPK